MFSRTGDVELRRAVRRQPAQVVADRQVVDAWSCRANLAGARPAPCAGRSSALASATTWRRDVAQRGLVVLDDVDAAQERLHGQAGRVPGAAAGRQHVVGAGRVVAERHRRLGADEDRAGVADPHGPLPRASAGLDLQVLGRVRVDHPQPLLEVVDEHRRRTAAGQRLA